MAAPPRTIRIAMLNADTPVAAVRARSPTYGAIFHTLLAASAKRLTAGSTEIISTDFDVVRGEYPSSPADFDALLITGSAASAYDQDEWCRRLDDYVMTVYRDFPQVKIFGSCFGHQMICQSLLREHGVCVEQDPNGWELGVHEIQLTAPFCKALGGKKDDFSEQACDRLPTPDPEFPASRSTSLRLQFIHHDHVKFPTPDHALPSPWIVMGRTPHCAVQGVYKPGHILTYQGHFEFDRFVNTETVKVFGAKWDPAFLQGTLDAMDKDDDSEEAANMVVRFLLEGKSPVAGEGNLVPSNQGLVTPPLEA